MSMSKKILCHVCGGHGFTIQSNSTEDSISVSSKRCAHCNGTGQLKVALTNADRVRAMSDEELAGFLDGVQEEECKTLHEVQQDGTFKFESLRNGWLAWLQQPAEEVHHER